MIKINTTSSARRLHRAAVVVYTLHVSLPVSLPLRYLHEAGQVRLTQFAPQAAVHGAKFDDVVECQVEANLLRLVSAPVEQPNLLLCRIVSKLQKSTR